MCLIVINFFFLLCNHMIQESEECEENCVSIDQELASNIRRSSRRTHQSQKINIACQKPGRLQKLFQVPLRPLHDFSH